jgi:hypothetical protein
MLIKRHFFKIRMILKKKFFEKKIKYKNIFLQLLFSQID